MSPCFARTEQGLSSSIADGNSNISVLQQTATSLTSTIASTDGKISQVQQTVINGGKIDTTEMRLDSLYGEHIYLKSSIGAIAAEFRITGAQTAPDACDIWAGVCESIPTAETYTSIRSPAM